MNFTESTRYNIAAYIILFSILFDMLTIIAIFNKQLLATMILLGIPFSLFAAYALLIFKEMLNKQFNFYEADKIIYMHIASSIVFSILGLLMTIFSLVSLPVMGVLVFLLGKKVGILANDLYGYKTKFTKTAKYAGVFLISVILSLIGIFINMLNSYYMGRILLSASKNVAPSIPQNQPSVL